MKPYARRILAAVVSTTVAASLAVASGSASAADLAQQGESPRQFGRADGPGAEHPPVASEKATSTPEQLREHWTPERVQRALAHPMDTLAAGPARTLVPSSGISGPAGDSVEFSADAAPPKNPTDQTAGEQEMTASTTVSRSEVVPYSVSWPTRATGKLIFDVPGGSASCTASVIVSDTKNAVWTAAHCLHGGKGGGFYKNFVFMPAYKNGLTPWGWWFHARVIVPTKWVNYSDSYSSDLGALVVKTDVLYGNLQDAIGGYGYNFSDGPAYSDVHSYGYPVDGYNRPDSEFADGENMMYCRGNTVDGGNWDPLDERLRMTCDMGHGASGGPMVTGIATGNVRIVGVNSHRYVDSNGNWINNYLYSSQHASEARTVIYNVNN